MIANYAAVSKIHSVCAYPVLTPDPPNPPSAPSTPFPSNALLATTTFASYRFAPVLLFPLRLFFPRAAFPVPNPPMNLTSSSTSKWPRSPILLAPSTPITPVAPPFTLPPFTSPAPVALTPPSPCPTTPAPAKRRLLDPATARIRSWDFSLATFCLFTFSTTALSNSTFFPTSFVCA